MLLPSLAKQSPQSLNTVFDMPSHDQRSRRLYAVYKKNIAGELTPSTSQTARLFIEAVCDQEKPVECVESLISSSNGINALQSAVRIDLSSDFINSSLSSLLIYLQTPALAHVAGGLFLQKIVRAMASPPFVLDALDIACLAMDLSSQAERGFAWLLLQLVSLPTGENREYHDRIRSTKTLTRLLESPTLEARLLAQKTKHVLETFDTSQFSLGQGPGGRHNNDFQDFRQISILPTIDELMSSDPAFLRHAMSSDECQAEQRLSIHLDTHFRLLREDMLRTLREDVQLALGPDKKRSRTTAITGLQLAGLMCSGRSNWALQLRCARDLPGLPQTSYDDRVAYLKDNRKFLPHDSLGCLLIDEDKLVALVNLHRDVDLIAENPPKLCVQLFGSRNIITAGLLDLRQGNSIKLVLVNSSVFAYQPVLSQLQQISRLGLKSEILDWQESQSVAKVQNITPGIEKIIKALHGNLCTEISNLVGLESKIQLDSSQAQSLIAGISQKLSLVQGPPGKSMVASLFLTVLIPPRHWQVFSWSLNHESAIYTYEREHPCFELQKSCLRSES